MLSRDEFERLFDGDWSSAWRWECQGEYHEPEEREPLRRFLSGESDDQEWFRPWLDRVRGWVAEGRGIGRARMLTDPVTVYLRFELALTPPAIEAGEDIRFMTQAHAADLGAPTEDFWMFDDQTVVVMMFGEHGVSAADVVTDPVAVRRFAEWREVAQHEAVPYASLI